MPKTTSKSTIKNMSDEQQVSSYYTQTAFYPWQLSVWKKLYAKQFAKQSEQRVFPHALLFTGIAGTGKKSLAFYLTKGLLCQSPNKSSQSGQMEPCHACRSCQLFNSASHPDFYYITTPVDKKVIPVDNIRELIQWSVLSSQYGGKKVILIEPAEAMNINAANSLLKTLEEPVPDTIIILISNKKQALLPTIRSRCQTIDLALPEKKLATQWLNNALLTQELQNSSEDSKSLSADLLLSLASGSPLRALNLSHGNHLEVRRTIINLFLSIADNCADPIKVAEQLFKHTKVKPTKSNAKKALLAISNYDIIYWLDSVISDLARLAHNCEQDIITNIDYADNLQQLSNRLYLRSLLQLSDLVNKAYFDIQGQVNINLLFENLLIDWKNCKK